MAKALLVLQAGGRAQIEAAAGGFGSYLPTRFCVGDQAGFVPGTGEASPRGTLVYTGDASLIQRRSLAVGTTRTVLTIPEGVGPLNVGNILLFAVGDSGVEVPFASIVLPFQITKQASTTDQGLVGLPNPGNRLLVNITVANQVADGSGGADITVEVVAPEYANMAIFDHEANLPAPALNPWTQVVLTRSLATGGPVLVTRVSDSIYWAMPFFRDLRHPEYGTLSGGSMGDNYRERPLPWIWGQRFRTPASLFRGVIGGLPFTTPRAAAGVAIGGRPFK